MDEIKSRKRILPDLVWATWEGTLLGTVTSPPQLEIRVTLLVVGDVGLDGGGMVCRSNWSNWSRPRRNKNHDDELTALLSAVMTPTINTCFSVGAVKSL